VETYSVAPTPMIRLQIRFRDNGIGKALVPKELPPPDDAK
jgi:hypothetical protein